MSIHTRIEVNWQDQPAAVAILRGITPAHVHLVPRTPVVGPRYTEWSAGELDEQLYELRRSFVAGQFGRNFADCVTEADCRDYLEFDARFPTVAETLRKVFGSPERWGPPTDRVIDCDRGAAVNAAFRAEAA